MLEPICFLRVGRFLLIGAGPPGSPAPYTLQAFRKTDALPTIAVASLLQKAECL
jgi:hypothetical protein